MALAESLAPTGWLVLETGDVFPGKLYGSTLDSPGEVVFNTAMTGYQEILTDPSYAGQIVVMTYPLIGNYGTNIDDYESTRVHVAGMVVASESALPSHYKATSPTVGDCSLREFLARQKVPILAGVATRAIVRLVRSKGFIRGWIVPGDKQPTQVEIARRGFADCNVPTNIVSKVTIKKLRHFRAGASTEDASFVPEATGTSRRRIESVGAAHMSSRLSTGSHGKGIPLDDVPLHDPRDPPRRPSSGSVHKRGSSTPHTPEKPRDADGVLPSGSFTSGTAGGASGSGALRIVLFDFGCKESIVKQICELGVDLIMVPAYTTAKEVIALEPHGIILSNGPGDPTDLPEVLPVIRRLGESYPVLGICLGHQLISLAYGAITKKMTFGHHGANHTVKDLRTGRVLVTSHNHGFATQQPVPSPLIITHVDVNDGTVEGVAHTHLDIMGVQFHPEAGPGPQDATIVFDQFFKIVHAKSLTPHSVLWQNPSEETGKVKVLIIGSGPIVIGQAAEFDYAGTQACKAIKEEGYETILVNSNPATIMTDLDIADKVYIEPLTVSSLCAILRKERPAGLIASMGGQTTLNLAIELDESGVLEEIGCELLGTSIPAIQQAEDRELFNDLLKKLNEPIAEGKIVRSMEEGKAFIEEIGTPVIMRPAFTLGGTGGGIADTVEQAIQTLTRGLRQSPIGQVLIERSIKGWKELEYEVMRDCNNTVITVCNMENFDPVGVHTGDSIVVAPSQTLSDKDYHRLRTSAVKIISALKIQGGCNIQFAYDTKSDNYVVIEVNPRVSRSSALASKATGYPIAKISALLALGKRLDEIPNPVTHTTSAAFEPSLDYVVVKIPRWPFDKFPRATRTLGTQMKATGEVMALGRSFEEALQKALRSLEVNVDGLHLPEVAHWTDQQLRGHLTALPDDREIFALAEAIRRDFSLEDIGSWTLIDQWFLRCLKNLIDAEKSLAGRRLDSITRDELISFKMLGFSDKRLGLLLSPPAQSREVLNKRNVQDVHPSFALVDTCAGEFASSTPYFFSTYSRSVGEVMRSDGSRPKALVLGSGPIRIGQGVEFDYCSVRAVWALRELNYETIMLNSNPETVSTDFDTADRLFFEPLTLEDVLEVIRQERIDLVLVQFGGQTAINLAAKLESHGVTTAGTSIHAIDLAENRDMFHKLLTRLSIPQPDGAVSHNRDTALQVMEKISYPVVMRPSYVIGGRAMVVAYDESELLQYIDQATDACPDQPVLIDKYIDGLECEVDAVCDGVDVLIPGIFEHIECAGVHSGDSMAVYPPQNLDQKTIETIVAYTKQIATAMPVVGVLNIQFVIARSAEIAHASSSNCVRNPQYDPRVLILEVNPRASRTLPIIAKVTGIPLIKLAVYVQCGQRLRDLGYGTGLHPNIDKIVVKAPVFSFGKIIGLDITLGPEMKSTGEVLGCADTYPDALAKAFSGSSIPVHLSNGFMLSVGERWRQKAESVVRRIMALGCVVYATESTADWLAELGFTDNVSPVAHDAAAVEMTLKQGDVDMCLCLARTGTSNSSLGFKMRRFCVEMRIPCLTAVDTMAAWLLAHESSSAVLQPVSLLEVVTKKN